MVVGGIFVVVVVASPKECVDAGVCCGSDGCFLILIKKITRGRVEKNVEIRHRQDNSHHQKRSKEVKIRTE